MSNTLVIGDPHLPFCKKLYLPFLKETQKKYKCKEIFCVGDLVDNHAISYHEHDPNGRSASDEMDQALKELKKWFKAFPVLSLCKGNHDILPKRRARSHGLPERMIRSYKEIFTLPKKWRHEWTFIHNGFRVQHGTGYSGRFPHDMALKTNRMSTVIGHCHSVAGVSWSANERDLIWGMSVGCGIDRMKYPFWYGRDFKHKPIISCGVVLDNGKLPLLIPMKT